MARYLNCNTTEERYLYRKAHRWLRNNYGYANQCDICHMSKATKYDWAKVRGKAYLCKRENFMQLCRSCHIKYDDTRNGFRKGHKINVGHRHSKASILKMSMSKLGNKAMLGKHHSKKTIERIRASNLGRKRSKLTKYRITMALIKYNSWKKRNKNQKH